MIVPRDPEQKLKWICRVAIVQTRFAIGSGNPFCGESRCLVQSHFYQRLITGAADRIAQDHARHRLCIFTWRYAGPALTRENQAHARLTIVDCGYEPWNVKHPVRTRD